MERMRVEPHYARMMIEAEKYPEEVRNQLAALIAVQEAGGVAMSGKNCESRWQALVQPSAVSDGITQLNVFVHAQYLNKKERRDYDISNKSYAQADKIFGQLCKTLKLDGEIEQPDEAQQAQLVKCIIAGMVDELYIKDDYSRAYNGARDQRELGNRTNVAAGNMVVGSPFNLEIPARRGGTRILHLLQDITTVPSVDVLREVAPQLFTERSEGFRINADGFVEEKRQGIFNGRATGEYTYDLAAATAERKRFLLAESQYVQSDKAERNWKLPARLTSLQQRTTEELPKFSMQHAMMLLDYEVPVEVSTPDELLEFMPELSLEDIVPAEQIQEIMAASPDQYENLTLNYTGGAPYVAYVEESALENCPTHLPDGREIMYKTSSYSSSMEPLAERVRAYRESRCVREEAERKKAEAERATQEKVRAEAAAAELGLPSAVSIWRRMGGATNRGDGWVVRADGTLREPDSNVSQGDLYWKQILPGEVVLQYQQASSDDYAHCMVVHRPENLTAQQIAAAKQIEESVGAAQNAFGIDSTENALEHRRVELIQMSVDSLYGDLKLREGWDYHELASSHGITLDGDGADRVNMDRRFDEMCQGREAQVVYTQRAGDGDLDILAYYKWGRWNLNMRWRKVAGQPLESVAEVAETSAADAVMGDAMMALKARFNNR